MGTPARPANGISRAVRNGRGRPEGLGFEAGRQTDLSDGWLRERFKKGNWSGGAIWRARVSRDPPLGCERVGWDTGRARTRYRLSLGSARGPDAARNAPCFSIFRSARDEIWTFSAVSTCGVSPAGPWGCPPIMPPRPIIPGMFIFADSCASRPRRAAQSARSGARGSACF